MDIIIEKPNTEGVPMTRELLLSVMPKLSARQTEQFIKYYEMIVERNRFVNLTRITSPEEASQKHFADSVLGSSLIKEGAKVIDVGTGAGFPGLALKIACPEMELTLLDSLDKRVGFLRDTCEELGFADVACVHARAEEIPDGFREQFDAAASRAVARLNVLLELCLPYVKPGGLFLAMKGPELSEELREAQAALKTLGGTLERVVDYTIPGTDVTHSVALIRKTVPTPNKYPRRWPQIKKKAL